MNQENKKYCWVAYVVPVIVFLLASMLYFAPQFRGETLRMDDVTQYRGMAAENHRHYEEFGEDPQWISSMFGGMPAYMTDFKIPSWIIRHASKLPLSIMDEPAALTFAVMLCFWFMLLMWRVNPWAAMVAALGYGFSTYTMLIIGAGHIAKVWALAYCPLMIGGIRYTFRGGNIWFGGAVTALGGSLAISANHPQIVYYFILVIAALLINELVISFRDKIQKRFWTVAGVMAIAGILAVGSNAVTLYYTAQHTPETTRGGTELTISDGSATSRSGLDIEYATMWSYGRGESFNMLIPNLFGGASNTGFAPDGEVAKALSQYGARNLATALPTYWGKQPFTAGPTYLGAAMIFLAVLGMFLLENRNKWWIFAVTVFAILLAWGSNFMWFTELMFRILPGYNKFRVVSTTLVIVQFTVPLLAALALDKIWRGGIDRKKTLDGLKWSAGIVGGVALIFALFGGAIFSPSTPADFDRMYNIAMQGGLGESGSVQFADSITGAMEVERIAMLKADAWRSLLFVMLAAAVVLLMSVGKIKKWIFVAAMAGVVCLDLVPVNMRFVSWNNFVPKRNMEIRPTEVDKYIMADPELGFRVANFTVSTFNDALTSYFHRSVGGYHGAKLQRYQDIIDRHLSRMNPAVYDMLNTKYFIVPGEDGAPTVQLNPDASGAAWLVDSVLFTDTPDEEIDALNYIDIKREAVVDRRFEPMLEGVPVTGNTLPDATAEDSLSGETSAAITLVGYKPNHLIYEYESDRERVAVFSEIYYDKGWTAYIDGVESPYFRANYILRGMVLPEGEYMIEFKFRAPHFAAVSAVNLIASLIILLGFAAAAILIARQRFRSCGDVPQ